MSSINKIRNILSNLQFILQHYSDEQLLNETLWIDETECSFRRLKRVFPTYPIKVFQNAYTTRINRAIANNPTLIDELKKRWIDHFMSVDDNTRMFMVSLFLLTNLYDDSVSKMIMDYAYNCENQSNRFWTAMNVSRLTFHAQTGYYAGFYNDRKMILGKIAEESNVSVPIKSQEESPKRKLCVITYLLSPSIKNSMQRVSMMFANNLSSYYDETLVLCLDSCYAAPCEYRDAYTSLYRIPSSNDHYNEIKNLFDSRISVKIAKGKTRKERMQNAMNDLYSFNPTLIVDISDEYSPLSYYYSRDYYTAYFPLRGSASSQFFCSFIGDRDRIADSNDKYLNNVNIGNVIEWVFPEFVPENKGDMTRSQIGISDDAFCIVSIGNHNSYSDVFVDAICSVIKKNDRMVWLLVGSDVSKTFYEKYKPLFDSNRIIEWGYEDNLMGLCKECDVLLRYNMTGGSGGTAIAAMQGIPIVMTNFICDASRWLGKDYSSCVDYDDLAEELVRLYNDKDYYNQRRQITMKLVNAITDCEEKWKNLNDLITEEYIKWKNTNG